MFVCLVALTAAVQLTYFTIHLTPSPFPGNDGKSKPLNTEPQRIQPNEVQIPHVFVGLDDAHGSHLDEAVASLKGWPGKSRKARRASQYHTAGAQAMKTEATRIRKAPRKDAVSEKGPYDWNGGRRMWGNRMRQKVTNDDPAPRSISRMCSESIMSATSSFTSGHTQALPHR